MMTIRPMAEAKPEHFLWRMEGRVGVVTLNRPDKKNPLTFQSYAELRDHFRDLAYAEDVDAVVITGAGGNFCSGGDVFEIIEPLTHMDMKGLLAFTRMTGDLVKAIRHCGKIVIAAQDGICAGAGAAIAMASDLRIGTPRAKTAFLFTRVGLAGCDMGACAMLPRIIGQGRASDLLFSGRSMSPEEAESWGWFNRMSAGDVAADAIAWAQELIQGPVFAHGITKTMLDQEWNMGIDQAIEAEAQAQAICMQTQDFRRAFEAFATKTKPVFEGN